MVDIGQRGTGEECCTKHGARNVTPIISTVHGIYIFAASVHYVEFEVPVMVTISVIM
jgi:hypothetical protein